VPPPSRCSMPAFSQEEVATTKISIGKGCGTCNKTGYKGRVGLYEVMEINDELRELILVGASALELKRKRSIRECSRFARVV